MRRRITLAFVAVLAVSLILAGGISLYLVRRGAGDTARHQLLIQINALEASTKGKQYINELKVDPGIYTILETFMRAVTNDKIYPVTVGIKNNKVTSVSPSLPGVPNSAIKASIDAETNIQTGSVSGLVGSTAYALAPVFSANIAPGITSSVDIALEIPVSFGGENTWYFLVAGGVSLLVAAGLAAVISQRIAGHTVTAANAAQQIASGDFATRIQITGNEYPELAQLGSSLNTMAANLERSRDLSRQFLLSVSHDLRTPLTSIRGYAEAITEGVTQDPQQAASVVVAESDRLGRLIGDLLDLARIEARQFSLHFEPIDAVAVAISATEALRYDSDSSDVAIEFETPSEHFTMNGDADRLSQVVANLVVNALKFARSRVLLRVTCTANQVHIAVEDDGHGIAPEDLPRVFERHFTSGRGKSRTSGTGLGLAIVSELVSAMHGTIDVVSPLNADGGTRFTMHFPAEESTTP